MFMRLLRVLLSAWLAALPIWNARPAVADVMGSCIFSMTSVDFGQVNVLPGAAVNGSGVLSVRCPTLATAVGSTLYACVTFPTPRRIAGPMSSLTYDLYGPSPSTTTWSSTTPIQFPLALLLSGGTASTTVSAAILASQATAPPGSYAASVTASVIFGLTGCTVGTVYATSFTFPVRATVVSTCVVAAQSIAFGVKGMLNGAVDADGQISAQCTSGTGFTIGLDGGTAEATNPVLRRMQAGDRSGFILYGLYRDVARTLPWGASSGVNTVAGTGTAAPLRFPIYARLQPQPTPKPGIYADTIIVTVAY